MNKKVWIEKSIVKNRVDRNSGPRSLGKALWSPQQSKSGADIYKNMREVSKGDIILHLVDNDSIIGYSTAKSSAINTNGLVGTDWDTESYLIELEDFHLFEKKIPREKLLISEHGEELKKIASNTEVFFNKDLKLRQGAYLTPCSEEFLSYINLIYSKITNNNLPFITKGINMGTIKINKFEILKFNTKIIESGLFFESKLLTRFTTSLLTKPFVILTGLSGSGKTKLAQAFALWLCGSEEQYKIVPVGADWTNREPLLGFPNALEQNSYIKPESGVLDLIIRATKDESKPYFLILDEMNLSHVERYFADFLSTMESGEEILLHAGDENWGDVPAKISLPKNLFIVGTVNIDETTYMFSPKVLDRASVIEFRVTAEEMGSYLSQSGKIDMDVLKGKGSKMEQSFVELAKNGDLAYTNQQNMNETLVSFFRELKKAGAEFGYRTASEIRRFAAVTEALQTNWNTEQILDVVIMQKLLPKLHGSRKKLVPVLETLIKLCIKDGTKAEDFYQHKDDEDKTKVLYPIALEKLQRMYRGLLDNGFSSYAEA